MAVSQLSGTYMIGEPDLYQLINAAVGAQWNEGSAKLTSAEVVLDADGNGVALKVTVEAS